MHTHVENDCGNTLTKDGRKIAPVTLFFRAEAKYIPWS